MEVQSLVDHRVAGATLPLQETLSIPTMLSMTQCPKQLIKRL
jgi:hypothetical protein